MFICWNHEGVMNKCSENYQMLDTILALDIGLKTEGKN